MAAAGVGGIVAGFEGSEAAGKAAGEGGVRLVGCGVGEVGGEVEWFFFEVLALVKRVGAGG